MAEPIGRDRREYFRLVYPIASRPKIQFGFYVYEAYDVSERGVKFICDDYRFFVGTVIKGTITFHDGSTCEVEGQVLRITRNDVVLRLTKPIPERIILAEQRYIINKYHKRDRQ